MDPVLLFETAEKTVSLVSMLAKLIKDIKADERTKNTSLQEVLARLKGEAAKLSQDLERRLRTLISQVGSYGLNLDMTLDDQLASLKWYDVRTRFRLKAVREECDSIYRQLTAFLDDVTALLLCDGKQDLAEAAFRESLDEKRRLDGLFLDGVTLRELIDGLLTTTRQATAELRVP